MQPGSILLWCQTERILEINMKSYREQKQGIIDSFTLKAEEWGREQMELGKIFWSMDATWRS